MRAHGVDVSHHKPVRDFDALYESGVRFFGAKASEGNGYVDPALRMHRDGSRRRPFSLTIYYHFARSGSARRQAERLMDAVGELRANERLCLDLEVSPTQDPNFAVDWVRDFYEALMGGACSDRRPILYTSKRIWRQIGDPDFDLAGEIDLWVPRYNAQGIEPSLPKPWQDAGWTLWQYSDGEFPPVVTPGVGKCDANYFRGDDDALAAYARLGATAEPVA